MKISEVVRDLSVLCLELGDIEVRLLVVKPDTGEQMIFDTEGVDAWDGPGGMIATVQSIPAEKEPHLKLVK